MDYITFNSKFTQKIAIEKYHLKNIKDGIIYNGIPFKKPSEIPEITSAEHLAFLRNKFVIGTSCRFNAFKRIDRLIDAFSEFAKGKPDVVLLLVGDGVMKQKLEERVNQLNINSMVLFAGFQSNVQGYQKLMNICVFPSEDEPFGLVAVETLAMGKPTIVFKDAGGMLEILINDFPDDIVADIPELVKKLNYYYESKNTVNNILAHKRELIASRFDIKSMEEAFFAEYVKLLTS
ncbi:MAG: glycosyltransferase family 4 protein [Bacteroidetes bacterium]|nr:glycosyltransferase family 4 protein [Bacteroidota bacterium]